MPKAKPVKYVPRATVGEELRPLLDAMAKGQQQMLEMQQSHTEGLMRLGKILTAPKLLIKDKKGKSIGVQTLVDGEKNDAEPN